MIAFVRFQVARDAGEADHLARRIAQRLLAGQAPARLAAGIQVQFQLIDHLAAGADDRFVLCGVDAAETAREDILGGLAEQSGLFLETATRSQRAIDQRIASVRVLDEEHDVRHRVEHGLEQSEMRQHAGQRCVVRFEQMSLRVHRAGSVVGAVIDAIACVSVEALAEALAGLHTACARAFNRAFADAFVRAIGRLACAIDYRAALPSTLSSKGQEDTGVIQPAAAPRSPPSMCRFARD
jgi:hypothetical protein